MANMLVTLRLALGLVPIFMDVIKSLENEIPSAGQGEAKAEALRGIVVEAFKIVPDRLQFGIDDAALARYATAAATIIVSLLKKTGIWK